MVLAQASRSEVLSRVLLSAAEHCTAMRHRSIGNLGRKRGKRLHPGSPDTLDWAAVLQSGDSGCCDQLYPAAPALLSSFVCLAAVGSHRVSDRLSIASHTTGCSRVVSYHLGVFLFISRRHPIALQPLPWERRRETGT